jgi:CRP-like cAMP-binding protein
MNAITALSPDETALVLSLVPGRSRPSGAEFLCDANPQLLLEGWACRQRILPDGRRQIFDLVLPGDMIGFRAFPGPMDGLAVMPLTHLRTADISSLRTAALKGAYPGLAQILKLSHLVEERRLISHVVRLGRLSAYERVVDLLVEVRDRLATVGLGAEGRFPFPVTQAVLSDLLGLSPVHINRVLQQLRHEGRLEMAAGQFALDGRLDEARSTAEG